jgi:hypothetical protein
VLCVCPSDLRHASRLWKVSRRCCRSGDRAGLGSRWWRSRRGLLRRRLRPCQNGNCQDHNESEREVAASNDDRPGGFRDTVPFHYILSFFAREIRGVSRLMVHNDGSPDPASTLLGILQPKWRRRLRVRRSCRRFVVESRGLPRVFCTPQVNKDAHTVGPRRSRPGANFRPA